MYNISLLWDILAYSWISALDSALIPLKYESRLNKYTYSMSSMQETAYASAIYHGNTRNFDDFKRLLINLSRP